MTTSTLPAFLTNVSTPQPGVPRWVNIAAHAVPLATLPSLVWRLALAIGVPVGFSGELAELYSPLWASVYIVVLSAVVEGLALLTIGLVKPWGERVPRWMPRLGGRRIPTAAAAVPALFGAAVLTLIGCYGALNWSGPDNMGSPDAPQGIAGLVMTMSYAPLLAWGPLLGAVTIAYCVRRRASDPAADTRDKTTP